MATTAPVVHGTNLPPAFLVLQIDNEVQFEIVQKSSPLRFGIEEQLTQAFVQSRVEEGQVVPVYLRGRFETKVRRQNCIAGDGSNSQCREICNKRNFRFLKKTWLSSNEIRRTTDPWWKKWRFVAMTTFYPRQ